MVSYSFLLLEGTIRDSEQDYIPKGCGPWAFLELGKERQRLQVRGFYLG